MEQQRVLFRELDINKDKILAFAEDMVRRYPKRTEKTWDDQKEEFVEHIVDNDVKHELGCILGRWLAIRLSWMSQKDLREELHDALVIGVTPISEKTSEELIDEIWDSVVMVTLGDNPAATWDDVLADKPDVWLDSYEDYEGYVQELKDRVED
jgi:hypothetical protein